MSVLFAISVFCLCAVLWVAVSIARHVLATRRRRAPRPSEGFTEVFFDDKMEQLREHAAIARQTASTSEPAPRIYAPSRREPITQPAAVAAAPAAPVFAAPALRKVPQPATVGAPHRADWDYFNKDLGDLTDPYENTPRERSEARAGARRY